MGIHDLDWYANSMVMHHFTLDMTNLSIQDDQPSSDQSCVGDGNPLSIPSSGSTMLKSSIHPLQLINIFTLPKSPFYL